jgi:hypothetical protein
VAIEHGRGRDSIADCGLRILNLTAKNTKNAEKELFFVLFVFFVVKEFFVQSRIGDWSVGVLE